MTVTLTQVKAQLGVRHSDEDTYLGDLITRAKAWVERYSGQNIVSGEVIDTFTEFGDYLQLSRVPLIDLTEIAYVDSEGEDATLDVATVRPQDGKVYPPTTGWPATQTYSTITVTYDAGLATTPADTDAGMLLLIEHWYHPNDKVPLNEIYGVPEGVIATLPPRTPTIA
jgi:uncharacterized phiE125 gp8 family phage protein